VKYKDVLSILIALSLIFGLCIQDATASLTLEEPYHIKLMKPKGALPQQQDAERLWEQAVDAKGGRERLNAVHNLVISSRKEYKTNLGKRNVVREDEFYVLPHKSWSWSDYRPDLFGLRVRMYNYETNIKHVITEGEPHHPAESITENEKKKSPLLSLLPLLLETKWSKPTLIKASIGRIGLRPVDIVETTFDGQRIDFAFDRRTHLALRVSYYEIIKGKTYVTALDLSDYVEINGLKVPATTKSDGGGEDKLTYQFNVKYNEDIFMKPPSIEAGPEAWRPKKS
jgi:hypothetical protein